MERIKYFLVFVQYGDGKSPADTAVNIMQTALECCGYESSTDFSDYAAYPALPTSCCEGEPTLCSFVNAWSQGCKAQIGSMLTCKY